MLRPLLVLLLVCSTLVAGAVRIFDRPLPRFKPRAKMVRGAYHLHSTISHPSAPSVKEWSHLAYQEGLSFLVITDNNHQQAAPLTTKEGLIVFTAPELTTPFGHLVSLGAARVATESERQKLDLPEFLASRGEMPVVAHPADPITPWEGNYEHIAGFEIANLATGVRLQAGPVHVGWLPALLALKLNPPLALAQAYVSEERSMRIWAREPTQSLAGFCGTDATSRLPPELSLRGWQLVIDGEVEKGGQRGESIMGHLKAGRFYCASAAFEGVPALRFRAELGDDLQAMPGEIAPISATDALVVSGPESGDSDTLIVLFRNGTEVVRTRERELRYSHPGPGTYRAEIRVGIPNVFYGQRIATVAYSNRIRVKGDLEAPAKAWTGLATPSIDDRNQEIIRRLGGPIIPPPRTLRDQE